MTKLTFYGGVNEIGGTKILLDDNGTKLFLDFGMSFSQSGKFFSEFLQPRKCNGVGDFIEFGLLPDLKGIYREDYLKHMGREKEDNDCNGLLLSHAHADHAAMIHHLRADIPIYCSEETHAILKALNDTSRGGFTELTQQKKSFETYINKKGSISKKTSRTHPDIVVDREFNLFKFGDKFMIDDVEVVPYNVDHSLPGATGYIIHTSSGTIIYTGDIRFHGRRPEKTLEFVSACAESEPDMLIIEGTRVAEESFRKESDVEDAVSTTSSKSNGLTVCNWPVRDTDRMISFHNSAKRIGKKLAISLKQAYLIEQLSKCENSNVPELDDENLDLYAMRRTWGLIGEDCPERLLLQDYNNWERKYLPDTICYKDIKKDQKNFMLFLTNFDLKELTNIKPASGSVYIKSVCEPFDAEMEIDWQRIENWLNHFNLDINKTHVSGHASGPQLKNLVQTVKPKMIVPVHTENAKIYDKWWNNVHLFEKPGETIELKQ